MQIHSDPELLLSYADKELSSPDSAWVEAHLRDCDECRGELAQVRDAIAGYEFYHRNTLKAAIPAPPKPWPELALRLIDRPPQAGYGQPKAPSSAGYRWIAIAAGLFVIASVYHFSRQGRINAAELLSQASTAGAAEQGVNKRIQMKVGARSFTRQARVAVGEEAVRKQEHLPEEAEALRHLFQQANYSWDDPFSAKSFAQWREQLPQKEDHVRIVSVAGSRIGRFYEVRTTTSHGILYEANLTLSVSDLRPVHETLRFRDNEWVEITESPEPTPRRPNLPSLPSIASQSHSTESDAASVQQIPEILGPAEELRVLAALHRIGADLGEPVEIERNDKLQRIVVTGLGINETRQADIRDAVGGLPGVKLQFVEPSAVRVPAEDSGRNTQRPAAGGSALVAELEQRLGGGKDVRAIMDRVLDQSDASLVRAHALDKLARRFPRAVEAGLAPPDQQILTSLWTAHIRALENSRNILGNDITALLGPAADTGAKHPCSFWQECTPHFLKSSQDLDQVLTRTLAGGDGLGEPLGSEVRSAFARWVLALESYRAVPGR